MSSIEPDDALLRIAAGVARVFATPPECVARAEELAPLREATQSRAVGCWRLTGRCLELIGFLAADDMPANVQAGFVAATRTADLSQTEFGIVQAVTAQGPAVNHRAAKSEVVQPGSIGWLGRFGAASSLAVPLYQDEAMIGALAVATVARIEREDPIWRLVLSLAERF